MPFSLHNSAGPHVRQQFVRSELIVGCYIQADLDANPVTRNRPIILQSKDGHAIWVSQTLIDKHAPYPDTIEGGVIVRGTDGKPSGECLLSLLQPLLRPCSLVIIKV